MITFLVGQIKGIKQVERKRSDGSIQMFTLINVFMELEDKDGFPTVVSENIQFSIEEYPNLLQNRGKYIAVPYLSLSTKNGTYIFPSNDLQYFIFDKNPFDLAVNKGK
jgi:hypothetical protein